MTTGEFIILLAASGEAYCKTGLASIGRNDHMNELSPETQPTQQQMEAVVADFINFIGQQRGLDVGFYTADLK